MVVLRNVTTTTLNSLPSQAGRLIFDTTTKTLKYNTGVVDKELVSSTFSGPVGINTTNPDRVLELNSATGQDLRLTYNDSDGNALTYADLNITSDGVLQLAPSGHVVEISDPSSLKITGANGSTVGLILGSTLVTSSGTELNYLHGVTPGTATALHALVTDADNNLVGLADFQATQITATTADLTTVNATDIYGTLQTAAQPNITSVGTLTDLSVSGTFTINGTPLTVDGSELNYLHGVTPGTATASHALVTDSNNSIVGINDLGAATINAGTSITSPLLNVTNLLNLTVSDNVGNTTKYPLVITRETTATPDIGLGVGVDFKIENDANVNIIYGRTSIRATAVTADHEEGLFSLGLKVDGTMVEDILTVDHTGTITAFQLVESSDRRIKDQIVDVDGRDSLNKVMNIRVRDFVFKKDPNTIHRGCIAQELKEVIPNAVYEHEKEDLIDFHSIKSQSILFHLISAFQELSKEVQELKKQLNQ